MSLSAEQLELRRTRIGASEVGALLGCDPHKTALDLFYARMAPPQQQERDASMRWGLDVERAILDHWVARSGHSLVKWSGTLTSARAPALCATPDALVRTEAGKLAPADAKNVTHFAPTRRQWGAPGTGEVPTHYAAQIVVQVGLCEMQRPGAFDETGWLVACLDGAPPEGWPVRYDPDLFGVLHDLAAKFVRDHLVAQRPPDGWERDRRALEYVAARYRRATGAMKAPTERAVSLAAQLRQMRATRDAAKAECDTIEAQLLDEIGDAAGIEGVARWTEVAALVERRTNWEAVARELGAPAALVERHTQETQVRRGYRRLTLTKLPQE